ncbi:hypothetical protein ABVK25_012447 [Lepraria finkii]|uniref:Glucocorticoid receptor n=1 Tax=Lepraria finkii TaxID=1340010 RepID=A0ABR4AH12_9LECA
MPSDNDKYIKEDIISLSKELYSKLEQPRRMTLLVMAGPWPVLLSTTSSRSYFHTVAPATSFQRNQGL